MNRLNQGGSEPNIPIILPIDPMVQARMITDASAKLTLEEFRVFSEMVDPQKTFAMFEAQGETPVHIELADQAKALGYTVEQHEAIRESIKTKMTNP